MKNYIKRSIAKFREDALSSLMYDVFKWTIPALIIFGFSNFFPETSAIGTFLSQKIGLSVYLFIIICALIVIVTVALISLIYRRKYKALQRDNFTDELTGIPNHKAFTDYLPKRLSEVEQSQEFLSVILIDVDDFKSFNSNYGYNTADKIFRKLGQLLGNDKRATDFIFRKFHKGDEFIIIANKTKLADARIAAERKRNLISTTGLEVDGVTHKVTVCCGVTEYKHGEDTIETLIDRVSQALNEAKKKKGKNCTVVNY